MKKILFLIVLIISSCSFKLPPPTKLPPSESEIKMQTQIVEQKKKIRREKLLALGIFATYIKITSIFTKPQLP